MIVYLSHSLGSSNGDDTVRRQDNIANANDWLRFLVERTSWAVLVPWFAYVTALRELHRPRAFADQLRILARCDAIALVGGVISPHMRYEVRVAQREHIAIVDLTDLGFFPPSDVDGGAHKELLAERARAACTLAGREPDDT